MHVRFPPKATVRSSSCGPQKALGLTVPDKLLVAANEVIE
jgi:hypothetical protein